MEFIIIIFLQAIISAIFSGVIANAKKLDVGIWVIAGLVFGIFGLIASAGMPQISWVPIKAYEGNNF